MSFKQGLAIGGAMSRFGSSMANTFAYQRREAESLEEKEADKQVNEYAAQLAQNPDQFDLSQVPEDKQLAVLSRAAAGVADKERLSMANIEREGKLRAARFNKLKELNQVAGTLINKGDYTSAAFKLAEAYNEVPDGWKAEVGRPVDIEAGESAPKSITLKHLYTGEARDIPITKEAVNEAFAYVDTFSNDPKEFNAIAERDKAYVIQHNAEAYKNAENVYDDKNQKVGQALHMYPKDETGRYNVEDGPQMFLFSQGELRPVDQLPEGWTTQKIAQEKGQIAQAGLTEQKSKLIGGNLQTPQVDKAFETQGGKIMAPDAVGGFHKIPAAQAPAPKTVAGKEGSAVLNVKMPDGSTAQMTETAVRKNLAEAKKILEGVKDSSGNKILGILGSMEDLAQKLESGEPEEKEMLLEKISRLADDKDKAPRVRQAAKNTLSYLDALGITASGTGAGGTPDWRRYIGGQDNKAATMQ